MTKKNFRVWKMTNKIYVDGFVFMPSQIYRRHLSPPFGKCARFPIFRLKAKTHYHLFKQNVLSAHICKNTLNITFVKV